MQPLEFISVVCASLWKTYGIIADDADEQAARNYYNAGLRDPVEVVRLIAKNHGI